MDSEDDFIKKRYLSKKFKRIKNVSDSDSPTHDSLSTRHEEVTISRNVLKSRAMDNFKESSNYEFNCKQLKMIKKLKEKLPMKHVDEILENKLNLSSQLVYKTGYWSYAHKEIKVSKPLRKKATVDYLNTERGLLKRKSRHEMIDQTFKVTGKKKIMKAGKFSVSPLGKSLRSIRRQRRNVRREQSNQEAAVTSSSEEDNAIFHDEPNHEDRVRAIGRNRVLQLPVSKKESIRVFPACSLADEKMRKITKNYDLGLPVDHDMVIPTCSVMKDPDLPLGCKAKLVMRPNARKLELENATENAQIRRPITRSFAFKAASLDGPLQDNTKKTKGGANKQKNREKT